MTFEEVLDSLDRWVGQSVTVWWLDVETQRVFGRAEGRLGGPGQWEWLSLDGPGGEAVGFRVGEDALLALYRNTFSKARWFDESLCIEFGPLLVTVERLTGSAA